MCILATLLCAYNQLLLKPLYTVAKTNKTTQVHGKSVLSMTSAPGASKNPFISVAMYGGILWPNIDQVVFSLTIIHSSQ
ncbi:hypothetical protein EDD22DRAFT_909157 [Suillus occidentalis]|nr:hypothetical protein EDD22DRAFT_909157 [Suillus occidentalis]